MYLFFKSAHSFNYITMSIMNAHSLILLFIFALTFHEHVLANFPSFGFAWPEPSSSWWSSLQSWSCPGSLGVLEAGDSPGHLFSTWASGKSPLANRPWLPAPFQPKSIKLVAINIMRWAREKSGRYCFVFWTFCGKSSGWKRAIEGDTLYLYYLILLRTKLHYYIHLIDKGGKRISWGGN